MRPWLGRQESRRPTLGQTRFVPPPPEIERYINRVSRTAQEVLRGSLVGVYTTGSLALDSYVAHHSDVDIAIVADDSTTLNRRRLLAARIQHAKLPCPATGLELVVHSSSAAASASTDAAFLLEVNTGAELRPLNNLDPASRPRFWFVIDRAIARQSGTALYGPPAAAAIAPVSRSEMLQILTESLDYQLANIGTELVDSVVLNACRSLHFARENRWLSKPQAANWAIPKRNLDTELIRLCFDAHCRGRTGTADLPLDRAQQFVANARVSVTRAPA